MKPSMQLSSMWRQLDIVKIIIVLSIFMYPNEQPKSQVNYSNEPPKSQVK